MIVVFKSGAYKVMCKHILQKQNTWYYRRRIPLDVRQLYKDPVTGKVEDQLYFSLKTTDKAEACKKADSQTRRLDALWRAQREGHQGKANPLIAQATLSAAGLQPGDAIRYDDHPVISDFIDGLMGIREPGDPLPRPSPQDQLTIDILRGAPIPRTLSDAREKHFALGKGPKNKVGLDQFERAWSLLLEVAGDVTLENLRRDKANEFVLRMVNRGNGPQTIKRYLSQVRPVINTGIREFELTINNPFDSVVIPNRGESPRKPRDTFSMEELEAIQSRCVMEDDERRWAILMLSDTMTRLAEVVGLRKSDVFLGAPFPYINVTETEVRGLKNKPSERMVPLVGQALWAAQRAMTTHGYMLFPNLIPKTIGEDFNAGSASAALNKWLKENGLAKAGQTLHSFRHTMRDRLREVEAPSDLIDRIGGWKGQGVGETYGQGHSLELMQKYLLKAVRTLDSSTAS